MKQCLHFTIGFAFKIHRRRRRRQALIVKLKCERFSLCLISPLRIKLNACDENVKFGKLPSIFFHPNKHYTHDFHLFSFKFVLQLSLTFLFFYFEKKNTHQTTTC